MSEIRGGGRYVRLLGLTVLLASALSVGCGGSGPASPSRHEVPVTTDSEEARELFLEGRDLQERLRVPEARRKFEQALERDPDFALAWLGMATTSPTAPDFFDALTRAIARTDSVSEAERDLIEAASAAARGEPEAQGYHLERIVKAYPEDARAHQALAAFYFGRQEYETALRHYERVVELDPTFSQAYNQMGYADRFLRRYDDAAEAFERYIELIPDDPNPYDSYAEMLMEQGRFEDSIAQYRKALERDPGFVASYVGIGLNEMLIGRPEEARATFGELAERAVNDAQGRQAWIRIATTWIDEGRTDRALEAYRRAFAIAEAGGDRLAMANDQFQIGNILLEAGRSDEAREAILQAVPLADASGAPEETKQGVRRNQLYWLARVELSEDDPAAAEVTTAQYREKVEAFGIPFEVRQVHELLGRIALARGEWERALDELTQANQQDPRVLWLTAKASAGNGDAAAARDWAERTAHYNGLNPNWAFVRRAALEMLEDDPGQARSG